MSQYIFIKKDLEEKKEKILEKIKSFYFNLKNLFLLKPGLFKVFFILLLFWFVLLGIIIFSTTDIIKDIKIKKTALTKIEIEEKIDEKEEKDKTIFNLNIAATINTEKKESKKQIIKINKENDKNTIDKEILELNNQKENKSNNIKYEYDEKNKNIFYKVPNKELYQDIYNKIDIPNKKDKEELLYYTISKAEKYFLKENNKNIREMDEDSIIDKINLIILEEKLNNIDYIKKEEKIIDNLAPFWSYNTEKTFTDNKETNTENKIKVEKPIIDNGKEIPIWVAEAIINKDFIPMYWLPQKFSYTIKQDGNIKGNSKLTGETAKEMLEKIENFQSYTEIQSDFDKIEKTQMYSPVEKNTYEPKTAEEFNLLFYKAQEEYEKNRNNKKSPL